MESETPSESERVVDLLRSDRTIQALRQAHIDAVSPVISQMADHGPVSPMDVSRSLDIADALEATCHSGSVREILQRRVMETLKPPLLLTLEDLADEFWGNMRVNPDQFDTAYNIFAGNVDLRVLKANESEPFPVARIQVQDVELVEDADDGPQLSLLDLTGEWHGQDSKLTLWSKNGVAIELRGTGPSELWTKDYSKVFGTLLFAVLRGVFSDRQCRVLTGQMASVLPILVRSMDVEMPRDAWPPISRKAFVENLPLVRSCLNSSTVKRK